MTEDPIPYAPDRGQRQRLAESMQHRPAIPTDKPAQGIRAIKVKAHVRHVRRPRRTRDRRQPIYY